MKDGDSTSNQAVLIPVIARLKEIEGKCDSMGSRNEDFPKMKDRLTSIISRLQAGEEPTGEPLAYGAMARELFPVAHLFESLGFMTVGKEISHIERTLRELDPADKPTETQSTQPSGPSQSSAARTPAPGELELDREADEEDSDSAPKPWPVFVGLLALIAAIVVALLIVLRIGPFAPRVDVPVVVPPTPIASTTVATPVPVATPTRLPENGRNPQKILAESVAEARLAIGRGDVEAAVRNLSAAALIDRNDTSVLEIAEQLVTISVNDANHAANEQRWEDAERLLERARRTALRFGMPTAPIDRAGRQHASIVRFQVVTPRETSAIRAAVGKRIEVRMVNGVTREGRVGGVEGGNFLLEVEDNVGGGVVSYIDELPLSTIQAIKIYED